MLTYLWIKFMLQQFLNLFLFLANFEVHWWNPVDISPFLYSTRSTHFRAIKPSNSIQIFGQHGKQRKQLQCENVATRNQNLHSHFALGDIFQLDTWNSIWEWHGQHKMQSRLHTAQYSTGHNTTRQCGAELLGSVGNSVWGSALFSFAACAMQIQVDQMHYKYVENGLPNQARQPQMHQLSNCLPRQRRHNVHQIIAGAVTRQATGHGPSLDLWLLSGLVCLTGVVCAGWAPVG